MGWLQDLIRELAGGGGTIDSKAVAREAARRGFAVNNDSVSRALASESERGELKRGGRSGGGRGKGPGSYEYSRDEGGE